MSGKARGAGFHYRSKRPEAKCCECGYMSTSEGPDFANHMVEVHGYMRDGRQVFKRHYCYCGKPGLYRVGPQCFCAAHRDQAKIGTRIAVGRYDANLLAPLDENLKEADRTLRTAQAHHRAKGRASHIRT
jgi:hypothetical protein